MTHRYDEVRAELLAAPRTWLVTGAAGFIGSHLVQALLGLGQRVVGMDDFSTGRRRNLREAVGAQGAARMRFRLLRGDVRDADACAAACAGADFVLHQAAIASVPRSLADPGETHSVNVGGTLTLLDAAREAGVRRVVPYDTAAEQAAASPPGAGRKGETPTGMYGTARHPANARAADYGGVRAPPPGPGPCTREDTMRHAHAADAPPAAPAPAGDRSPMRLLANQLTATRLALIPVLWGLALLRRPVLLGAVLVLAALTDVLDGLVARRTRTTTRFGGAFDSVADHLLAASTVAFIVLLKPDFVREQRLPLVAWALFGLATLAYGWVRHRRLGNLHLYSAKLAGVAGYAFAAALFLLPAYSPPFFAVAVALAFLATAETLLVFATRTRVDEHAGSILLRPHRPPRDSAGALAGDPPHGKPHGPRAGGGRG